MFFNLFILGIKSIISSFVTVLKYFCIGFVNIIILIPKYFIIGIKAIFYKKTNNFNVNRDNKKISIYIIGVSLCIYFICVFLFSRWYVQGLKIKYLTNDIINSTDIVEKEGTNSNINPDNTNDKNNSVDDGDNEHSNSNGDDNDNNNYVYYPNDYWDYLNVPFMNVDFDELLKKNSDTVGWIKVDGTKVNYPIVQTTDNSYYLSHAFNKSNNQGGWIFADYRVNFKSFGKNTIIYGHNMNNKTMFGSIPNMLYDGYLANSSNYFIKLSTPTSNSVWKVFSIYTTIPDTYYLKTNFKSEPYSSFLSNIKNKSIYDFGVDVSSDDKILTLSTCDNTGTKRVAVHAKMISIEYK